MIYCEALARREPDLSASVKDLALLGLEFGFGKHSGVPELAELLELGQLVVGARGGRSRRSFIVLRLLLGRRSLFSCGGLVLRSPLVLLAALDASGDAGGGSRDNGGARDSTKQTWHGIDLS